MPLYKVTDAPTYIDSSMRQPGEVIDYAGWPGSTLEPQDDLAGRVKAFYLANARKKTLPRVPDLAQFPAPEVKPAKVKPGKPDKDADDE